jgi:hypothetical protein
MSRIARDVVKPPNQAHRGDHRANGFLPLVGITGTVRPPVQAQAGDRRGGATSLSPEPSTVRPPDHRFHVNDLNLAETPCAIEAGHGAIPVDAATATSRPVQDAVFLKVADA